MPARYLIGLRLLDFLLWRSVDRLGGSTDHAVSCSTNYCRGTRHLSRKIGVSAPRCQISYVVILVDDFGSGSGYIATSLAG
jgi:hypothetical protein